MKLFSFFNKEKNIPDQIYNNCNKHIIYSFVIGDISINQFYEMLYNDDAIFDYLQSIVDFISKNNIVPKRRTVLMKNVNQNKPFELRSHIEDVILKYRYSNKAIYCFDPTYCPTVKEYLKFCSPKTALGAFKIHSTIADIYYQLDQDTIRTETYNEAYEFSLDVLPSYLGGEAEQYISEYIIAKAPDNLSKTAKKKLVKEEIKKQFKRQTKGYPRWIQEPNWPISDNHKPMVFVKQKNIKAKTEHDDYSEYYFIDEDTGEERIIRQYW